MGKLVLGDLLTFHLRVLRSGRRTCNLGDSDSDDEDELPAGNQPAVPAPPVAAPILPLHPALPAPPAAPVAPAPAQPSQPRHSPRENLGVPPSRMTYQEFGVPSSQAAENLIKRTPLIFEEIESTTQQ